MLLLRALADRISDVTYDALPAQAIDVAKQGILDTVGVTLAGARDETTAIATRSRA
jgi:2-methylcitrate dehydratase PrpD